MGVVYFNNDVAFKWLNHISMFEITEPLGVFWVDKNAIVLADFTIPIGYRSNGPSIPKRLRSFIPFEGHWLRPSFSHDWLYDHHEGLDREQSDEFYFDAMVADGVIWHRRHLIYRSVRLGGEEHWAGNDKEKEQEDDEEDFDD